MFGVESGLLLILSVMYLPDGLGSLRWAQVRGWFRREHVNG